jgi:hypothetical protein
VPAAVTLLDAVLDVKHRRLAQAIVGSRRHRDAHLCLRGRELVRVRLKQRPLVAAALAVRRVAAQRRRADVGDDNARRLSLSTAPHDDEQHDEHEE